MENPLDSDQDTTVCGCVCVCVCVNVIGCVNGNGLAMNR